MKFRSTLILLLIAIALGTYISLVENNRATTREKLLRAALVVDVDRDSITQISIHNTETQMEFDKSVTQQWEIRVPVKDRADWQSLSQLLTTLETLKHESALGADGKGVSPAQLKEFGLTNSETWIKVLADGAPVEIILGKDAAVEGHCYVKVASSDTVYVIKNDLKNQITKKPDDFRDRRLTDLRTPQVNRLTLKLPSGDLELEKKNEHWQLVKPLKARGDDGKIGDLIAKITGMRIDSFLPESSNPEAFAEPRATVSLFTEGDKTPVVLQIGQPAKDEKTYAKLSNRQSVMLLPKPVENLLQTKPNDLRDKNLLRVEADIVDRITLEDNAGSKLRIVRRGEQWARKTEQEEIAANGSVAVSLLNALNTQQIKQFVADVATDLPKYGLDLPSLKVTLSSFASENTAESRAGELPIVTVLFGKTEGGLVYVKLEDEPFVLSVDKAILARLPTEPILWQQTDIYRLKPEEITSLEITRSGHPLVSLERDKDKWKLAKGDGTIHQINAQSLLNTLTRLRAVRWSGPAANFENPSLVLTFKTTSGQLGKLTLGVTDADDMTLATAEGFNGTFLISRPDREAFELPLLERAPAAASTPAIPPPAPKLP